MNQMGDDRIERLMELEPAAIMASFRSGTISRRDLSKLFAALGLTAALGPAVAAERLADHVIVTRSDDPRIQEAQDAAYHVLRELVELAG